MPKVPRLPSKREGWSKVGFGVVFEYGIWKVDVSMYKCTEYDNVATVTTRIRLSFRQNALR